ncbi:MAG TPA: BTAD domain-containing putative transcriptional regulator, partial [Caldilineaceae bacterium]|nr:BTAD domain-containing putative transcriptional regulator [Caldilineaceae bacterium]
VAHHQTAGDPAAAIPYARRLLALDNLHEPAHRGLMRLYALAGQQAAALRQYEECLRLLDEELGVPPEAETTELHEAIRTRRFAQDDRVTRRQGDTPTSPPHPVTPSPGHPVTPSPGHNLPPQATPFVGRQREVEAVLALLAAPNARLVTITGVGGIGKSRLGLAVAEALLTDFPDGVWFVPLAQVEAADGVPAAIAAALSAPSGGEPRSSLIAFLREKKALLLLDNFEHLLDAADFLAEVLPDAPGVKVLVTSQERLNLLEESLYPLAGLSLEGEGAASSALTLFEQTARRVQPDFSLNKEKSAVTAICQAVEGMPLGIELAAGWVRVMSCAEIAAEIQRGVDFLSTTLRNLPPRHRSLRAVFARSWALLDPDEQNLLARLSVFQGGFTRQAGAEVADATPRQLAGLMDHSFLRRQAGERFDMHGLMHRFAGEKLAAQPAIEADARQRHADFYADLMAQAGWELEPGDAAVSAALEGEAPNFLAAWRRGVENRDASVVGRMMRWLVDYFRRRGDYRGGEAAFASAVQAFRSTDGEAADAGLLGSLLLRLGKCIHRDREEVGLAVEREAVALLRRAAPAAPLDLAQALTALGMSHASLGHNPEATELATEALALLREIGNEVGVGATLRDIGYVAIGWGRPREAQRYIEESVHVLEGREHKSYVQSTYGLGLTLLMRGHYRRARALLRRALPYFVEQGENGMAGYTDRSLAELYTATGDFASARHHFSETFARFEPVGIGYEVTNSMYLSPAALARLADEADAEAKLLDALATARRVGYGQPIATSLHHLARLRHDQRDYEGALALLDEALSVARKIDFRYATALVLTAQGHSLLALKQTNTARAAYAEALEIADAEGIDRIVCDGLTGIAQLAQLRGDSQLALSLLHFVHIHEASEWETKRRAERLMADLPRTETHTPIPSLEEAIRLARVARDDRVTRRPGDTPTSPPHPVTPSPGHLPVPTTSFIGREGELSELSALLARPDVRLATVVAPGGMGKTRFAIEAARRLAGDFPDGVWFLSLVGVNEASQMLAALVQLLDAPMGAGGAKEAVQRFLARRRLLLVLDNFEQLVDSAEVLAEIVQGAPDVKVLVTSRVRLNLREEWAFPLTGLGMESVVTDDTVVLFVGPNEAIRLFAERARQMQPGFDAATEAEAVAAICRTVEGMPLGIELAASWLRAMKCGEIAAEIRRDVDFLSTPLRNVPEQHRSMRAVFERSWALLTPNEQRGLARLSVFQGGFTRAAAEAVAEVRLPLLSALVDHSLLRHGASGRYDIHELLRQFAAEQLAKSGEAESIRDKHAICFFGYLSQRREALQWRQMQPALDELIPERENLFAGWRWSCEQGHFSGLREAATLLPLY